MDHHIVLRPRRATVAISLTLAGLAIALAPVLAEAQGKPAPAASVSAPAGPAPTSGPAPSAPPTAGPVAAGSAPATPPGMDASTYTVRLRDLEQRINELKEQIRRSHTRLALLSESILSGITAAARAEVTFQNDMSSAFRLKRVVALYDGAPLATKTDDKDGIGDMKEVALYAELVQPGDHTLQFLLEYQGNGYGIFSYLKGYKFEVRSSRSFTALEGKSIAIRVIGYEQGGPTTPLEERPAVRYTEKVSTGVAATPAPGAKK